MHKCRVIGRCKIHQLFHCLNLLITAGPLEFLTFSSVDWKRHGTEHLACKYTRKGNLEISEHNHHSFGQWEETRVPRKCQRLNQEALQTTCR